MRESSKLLSLQISLLHPFGWTQTSNSAPDDPRPGSKMTCVLARRQFKGSPNRPHGFSAAACCPKLHEGTELHADDVYLQDVLTG